MQTTFHSAGTGASIRFGVGACSLGSILVAATEQGIGVILLGDGPGALVRDLRGCFPIAQPAGDEQNFAHLLNQVAGFTEAPWLDLGLPLGVRGTAFQQSLWQALREIPAGSTASYGDTAARIGAPKKAYAVEQACASNVIAVAIPGRWGVARKRAFLERETRV